MVGFSPDSTIEEDLNQQPPKFKNSNELLPLDLSVSELEVFSSSFADSFLDFDSIRDWIEENPVLDMADSRPVQEKVDSVTMGVGTVEGFKGTEAEKDGSSKDPKEATPGDGFQNSGNLGSSIEQRIAKVSLEGDLNGSKNVEMLSVNGNGEWIGVDDGNVKSAETIPIKETDSKGDEIERGEDEIGATSGSESAGSSSSDSDNESSSSASASSDSESSGSSSLNDEELEQEEEEDDDEPKERNRLEEEIDMEEGEIMDSDEEKMVAWSDGEGDEEDIGIIKGPIRSKNELKALPPVPPVNVTLGSHHQMLPVGVVLSIIGAQVIVEGVEKHNPLNEGSVLWITESRSPLGLVDEIFGPVKNPYYIIRYNSENEVPDGIKQGTSISFVPDFVNHVLNDKNLYKKGYDASGENDEEVSDEAEFSDDEKEAEYRRMQKITKRGTYDGKFGNKLKDKKYKNRGKTWQNGQPSTPQRPEGLHHQLPTNQNQPPILNMVGMHHQLPTNQNQPPIPNMVGVHHQPPTNQNQLPVPNMAVSMGHGNAPQSHQSPSSGGFLGGPIPPFPQLAQAPGFMPPGGVLSHGMPGQQQQNMMFNNGLLPNGMPWLQQSQQQQSFQMPFPNGIPFQQQPQFVPGQGLPSFPGPQPNFSVGPAFAQWPPGLGYGQSGFNQQPFGMGLQCQQASPSMNVGEQLMSLGSPPSANPGNNKDSQKFIQGPHRGHGRRPHHRGSGSRFGGGRGRR